MQQYNTHYFEFYDISSYLSQPQKIECIEGGSISYNSLDSLKISASLTVNISNDETFSAKKIRIYCVLNGMSSPLGTFLIATPSSDFEVVQSIDVTCYSTLWPVKVNKCDERYFIPKGTNVVNEVKRLLLGYEYTVNIPSSSKTTSIDQEFKIGTSHLEIINSLLDSIGYSSLYEDFEGNYCAREYILPENRETEIIYDKDDIDNILEINCKSELDLFNIPNKFIRYVNDPEIELAAIYTNIYGVTGTERTGIVNVDAREVKDVADYDTLYLLCKKAAAEATSIYHKVTIYTAINPEHLYLNCIQLNHHQCRGKYIETSWEIELSTGGTMTHHLREEIAC